MNKDETIKEIKHSFRLLMNGVATDSMRRKGLSYHLSWGISLSDLRKMSEEYEKDINLAISLWKENIRECKILATMLMPCDEMLPEIADIWISEADNLELVEALAFNLLQNVSFASDYSFKLISSNNDLHQICGFHILSRLFIKGLIPCSRDIDELIDQIQVTINGYQVISLKKAALACANKLYDLLIGSECNVVVDKEDKIKRIGALIGI